MPTEAGNSDISSEGVNGNSSFAGRESAEIEVVEGLLLEGDICALGSAYGRGKTPLLQDLTVHITHGIPWCGRPVIQRPVIVVDFETKPRRYRESLMRILARVGVEMPDESALRVFFALGDPQLETTKELFQVTKTANLNKTITWLQHQLARVPDAVIMIDPADLFFPVNFTKSEQVLPLFFKLRMLSQQFPKAAFVFTFNLRKLNPNRRVPDLLLDPRGWLEEVGGSSLLLARADVRLGMDAYSGEGIRILNGIRRGEEFEPLLLSEVGEEPNLAGFSLASPDQIFVATKLTPTRKKHWSKLPPAFKFEDYADKDFGVPRASLKRLLDVMQRMGAVRKDETGVWHKNVA